MGLYFGVCSKYAVISKQLLSVTEVQNRGQEDVKG